MAGTAGMALPKPSFISATVGREAIGAPRGDISGAAEGVFHELIRHLSQQEGQRKREQTQQPRRGIRQLAEDHHHRPMPQVEREGALAQPPHHPGAEEPCERSGLTHHTPDHCRAEEAGEDQAAAVGDPKVCAHPHQLRQVTNQGEGSDGAGDNACACRRP